MGSLDENVVLTAASHKTSPVDCSGLVNPSNLEECEDDWLGDLIKAFPSPPPSSGIIILRKKSPEERRAAEFVAFLEEFEKNYSMDTDVHNLVSIYGLPCQDSAIFPVLGLDIQAGRCIRGRPRGEVPKKRTDEFGML